MKVYVIGKSEMEDLFSDADHRYLTPKEIHQKLYTEVTDTFKGKNCIPHCITINYSDRFEGVVIFIFKSYEYIGNDKSGTAQYTFYYEYSGTAS